MNARYRPDRPFRPAVLAAATVLSAAFVATAVAPAWPEGPTPTLAAEFTGEMTSEGPVYRLPTMHVHGPASLEAALPRLVDRALERAWARDRNAKPAA